ncbi:MAG: asparaginase [Suilimivivens sp.]
MKKILVVLTGGTIGSRVEDHVINVSEKSPYRLLSMYEESYGKEEFEVIKPLNILSENMTPDYLLILLKALDGIDYGKYAGVIVTHGSDTLSYTSAFAGLLFNHIPVPMVFVASNYPLGQRESNGLINFAGAVDLIRSGEIRGIFTLYQDREGISQVYLATRIHEAEPVHDQFRDFGGVAFGRMENGHFALNEIPGETQPSPEEVEEKRERKLEVPVSFSRKVMLIRPYPGMDYSFFRFGEENKPAAILHYLYHSATSCLAGEEYSLLSFAERCKEQNIDVYVASCKRTKGEQYVTGDTLLKTGIIPLLNISPEAAYAKLMLLYNGAGQVRKDLVWENIYFESVKRRNV